MLDQIHSKVPTVSKLFRFLFGSVLTENKVQQDWHVPCTCLNANTYLLLSLPFPVSAFLCVSYIQRFHFPSDTSLLCLEGKGGAGADSVASPVSLTQAQMHTPPVMCDRWQSQQVKIAGRWKNPKGVKSLAFFIPLEFSFLLLVFFPSHVLIFIFQNVVGLFRSYGT